MKTHLIDVRSSKEYMKKRGLGLSYVYPNINAINIEWKEFFDQSGRPNFDLKERLLSIGIGPNDRVLLLSNQGRRSAAATVSLLSLGYRKAANVSGGYVEVLDKPATGFR